MIMFNQLLANVNSNTVKRSMSELEQLTVILQLECIVGEI